MAVIFEEEKDPLLYRQGEFNHIGVGQPLPESRRKINGADPI